LNDKAGQKTGKVDETFVERDETGNTLTRVSDTRQFEVTSANWAAYQSDGAVWSMTVPLVAGATKITIVVRDSNSGHVGSLTVPLK